MLYRTISIDRYEGFMTRHEHAVMVTKLLDAQDFSLPPWVHYSKPKETDISPTVQKSLLQKLRLLVKEEESRKPNELSPLFRLVQPGTVVTTRHPKIGDNYGNVISESEYFPQYWFVHFYRLKRFDYVHVNYLKFHSKAHVQRMYNSPANSKSNEMEWEEVQNRCNDNDLILLCILNSKIHRTDGYKDMSATAIADLFSKYFPLMNQSKIQRMVNKYRSKIEAAKKSNDSNADETNSKTKKLSPDSVLATSYVANNIRKDASKYAEYYHI